ncbi:hypothetical protein [Citrobacter freundii]|uniref:hypothetical protein n=1 Tax=Citrobacter freundii TaxID=546 RepID=UPI00174C4BDB|nr:hypothetical protein [Citrobacter freundii]MBD5662447.1 hypothetical protein [Citrobacter freundii]HDP7352178.1 hypothetical protein [Escherichia coli]
MINTKFNTESLKHLKYISFGFGSALSFALVSVLFAIKNYTSLFFINTVVAGVMLGVSIYGLLVLLFTENNKS